MNRASATSRIAGLGVGFGLTCALLWSAAAIAQTAAPPEAPASLSAVDFNFVGQANLGAPFQVDSGRLAETKGTSAAIRSYAHLMVTSHIPVVDALNVILKRKNITPSNTLLHGAYDATISTLEADRGAEFDRDKRTAKARIKKGKRRLSNRRFRTAPILTSSSSRAKPCRRSWTISSAPRSLPLQLA